LTSHAAVNSDERSIRSLLEIFGNAAKQSCRQLQCNKAKLSEPASINGLRNISVYARASLLSAYTNENRVGHIYTARGMENLAANFGTAATSLCRVMGKHGSN